MWALRKFYGGNGGAIPPTDPRMLAMTIEQMDMEFAHMMQDKIEKGEVNAYKDDEYDAYDEETDDVDESLSGMEAFGSMADPHTGGRDTLPKQVNQNDEDEWEDVEIDD